MKTQLSFSLLAATALGAGWTGPALAESQDPSAANEVASDIIVTARRVEERLQDVPISITVFDQGQLNDRNVFSAKDLATYTPSLSTNTRFGNDSSSFAIRGFSQESRTTASVGTYFADVVAPRGGGSTQGGDGAGPGSFFDLQNVQVLKGPQGTLFGRNTTGGAVLLVPKKPTDRLEGYVEGSAGNYDMYRAQAVVNVPLSDTLRIRAGVDRLKRDGFLKNVSGIGPKDFADVDYLAARLSIVGELTSDLENYVVASYTKSTPHGSIPKITDCFAPFPAGSVPAALPAATNNALFPFGVLSCQQVARESGQGWNAVSNSLFNASQEVEQWQIINTTTWRASDNLTIKNIMSYAQLKQVQHVDLFGTDWIFPATLTSPSGVVVNTGAFAGTHMNFVSAESIPNLSTNNQSTFTEELQFQGGSADGKLTWQAGAYFELSQPLGFYGAQNPSRLPCANSATFQCTDVFRALAAANPTAGLAGATGTLGYQGVKTEFRDIGAYAQASYALTEQIKLTGGIRYTWDRTRSVAEKLTYRFLTANTPTGFCTNPLVRSPSLPISAVNATSECREFQEQKSKAPTWVLGVDFKLSRDLLLYAKWARGYRQGATNPFGPDGLPPFRQEKVDTYEAGTKAAFRGAISGTFNLSGFYNDFRDQQLNASFTRPLITGLAPNAGIVNVGKSRIYGFEVETVIVPFDGFRIQGSYAYLNTKVLALSPIPAVPNFGPASHLTVLGGELPFTPKHKLSISANYTLPLDETVGKVTIGTTYSYNGRMFTAGPSSATVATLLDVFNKNGVLYVPAYDLLDINASWENIARSNIDASFFVTNVGNKHYFLARNIQPTSGFISRYLGEPRTWGLRLRYNFGGE